MFLDRKNARRARILRLATAWIGSFLVVALEAPGASALDPSKAIHHYSHTVWTTREGLTHDSVGALAETSDGYVFIGTGAGLLRFDGRRFTLFDRQNTEAFSDHDVSALILDRRGDLWIGTDGGGIVVYSDGEFRAFDTESVLGTGRVKSLLETPDGLLVGTYGGGLGRLRDGAVERIEVPELSDRDVVRVLLPDARGGAFLGTYRGLRYWPGDGNGTGKGGNREGGNREDRAPIVIGTEQGLPSNLIFALERTPEGDLWLGTDTGLARYDIESGTVRSYDELSSRLPNSWILSLHQDSDALLWIGTSRGLVRWQETSGTIEVASPLPERYGVNVMLRDSIGSLWAGSNGGGLHVLQEGPFTTYDPRDGLHDSLLSGMAEDARGGLWIAGEAAISYLHQGKARVVSTSSEGPIDDLAWTVMVDSSDRVWFGTGSSGLYFGRSDATFEQWQRPRHWQRIGTEHGLVPGFVVALVEGPDGTIWVGTNGGLSRIERDAVVENLTLEDGLPSNQIRSLWVEENEIYIGTTSGLVKRRQDGSMDIFGREHGLPSLDIWDIHRDGNGTLWLATNGGGLVRFADGRGQALTSEQGLADDKIYGLVDDRRGGFWLCASRGVVRLETESLGAAIAGLPFRQTLFGRGDGLPNPQCGSGYPVALAAEDGRLWMGTLDGPAVVDPARIPRIPAPRAIIETLSIDGRDIDPTAVPELEPDHLEIRIRLSAPTQKAPRSIDLRYRLFGFDADWKLASEDRLERYTRLPAGEYVFEAQASDSDGAFTGEITRFELKVRPRHHETFGFWLVIALLSLASAYSFHRARIRRHWKVERELERRVDAALSEIETLSGLLPICAACKKVRDDDGYWTQIEVFINQHSAATFSHSLCPNCADEHFAELDEPTPPPDPPPPTRSVELTGGDR